MKMSKPHIYPRFIVDVSLGWSRISHILIKDNGEVWSVYFSGEKYPWNSCTEDIFEILILAKSVREISHAEAALLL